MDWLYLFTKNNRYPDPLEEISFLKAKEEDDGKPYLLLNGHKSPPMSSATQGERVCLATRLDGIWQIHGIAQIAESAQELASTPADVEPLYGSHSARVWIKLEDIQLFEAQLPEELGITKQLVSAGQASVFRLSTPESSHPHSTGQPSTVSEYRVGSDVDLDTVPLIDPRTILSDTAGKTFVGVDLTAGNVGERTGRGLEGVSGRSLGGAGGRNSPS